MLRIHKPFSKHKLLVISITSICIVSGLLGISALTYTPELSHAETVTYRSLDDITYMQDMTAAICAHSHENETKQLIDSRDGKTYWVTKLKDQNCWMTQNLAIIDKTITPADSDISSGSFTIPASDKIGFAPNDQYQPGAYYEAPYGGYYNLYTATAGNGGTELTHGYASSSICPKGWRLPVDEGEGSYMFLFNEYGKYQDSSLVFGEQNILMWPISLTLGGALASNNIMHTGVGARYWTSRISSSRYAYAFSIQGDDVYMAPNSVRQYGYSVRCVARNEPQETRTLANIEYMQDITADICANTPEATADGKFQYQLKDKRDGKTYWTAKLKDNNCWMTQNLALNLDTSKSLTSTDSDVKSAWMPPYNTSIDRVSGFSTVFNEVASYSPGDFVYVTPTEQNDCAYSAGLEGCKNWVKIEGLSVSKDGNKQAHYLAGNYYSWGAVTAGQAAGLTSDTPGEQSTQSICPAKWSLPSLHEYGALLSLYGEYEAGTTFYGSQDIRLAPLYLLYGGRAASNNTMMYIGAEGYYWLSTANGANSAYSFLLARTGVKTTDSWVRYAGFSVRCLAPGGEKKNADNIEITINPQLSLEITPEVAVTKSDTNPSTGNLDAKVVSNMPYTLQINAKDNTSLTSPTSSTTIPVKSGLLNTTENGWGIKLKENAEFTALSTNLQTFYTASGAEIQTTSFTIGISTAPDIPNGEYSTDLTITATQN